MLADIDEDRPELPDEVTDQVEISIKYDGYIKRQLSQVEKFKKLEVRHFRKISVIQISMALELRHSRSWIRLNRFQSARRHVYPVLHLQIFLFC